LLAIWPIGLAPQVHAEDQPAKYDLGGPRQVKAEVSTNDNDYVVVVRMRPVRVFDKATNAEINQEKARLYALQALGRHLAKSPDAGFIVSGATVAKASLDGAVYALTLRVPQSNFKLVTANDNQPKEVRVRYSDAFLRARQDHENTIRQ